MALAMSTADGGQFEDLGVPVHKAALMETIIGPDRTGTRDMVYMNFVQGAGAAFVLAVDPETGESRQYAWHLSILKPPFHGLRAEPY